MSSNNLNIDSECNVDGDVDNTISLQQLSRGYANPQAIIIALSNSSHILSLISSIQQTYNVHPKFRRGLVVYLINSLFDKHVEQEMSPGLSLIMQQETRFSVSYISHIPSVNSQKTIISEFRKGILQHLPENSPHDSLYLQKILEGYYVGKMIAGLVDLQSKPSFTALDFLNSIYSISSFTVSNVTFGAFKERCNLGLRENYIYSFNASSALFEEIYVKTYDMESCGLLRYENSKRNSISSVSKDAIQQPLVLVRLIPFEENESLPRNTLTLLSNVYDSSDEYVKGLQYFINIYNTKPRTHQFQQIRLHTEYYGLRQGKYSLEAKMKAMIEKQGVFAFVGTVLTLNTSYPDINSLLKAYNVPMLTLSQSLELRSPYSKYFINLRPSILDETASMINYFQTFGSIAIVYANTFEWTNNAIPTITQYCYANDFSVVMQPFNDMKDLQNILTKIEPKSIIVLGSDKDVETALKAVGDSSSYIRNIGFLSGSYTPTLQLQMQQILYRISNKYLYLPTLTTTPKIDNDVCAQDSSYSSQQNMKTFLSYYKQSNPDLHTLEGFLTGYFIETLLERAYQLSTTVTTNDFITTIFSGRTFNLMELMEVGPFGLECSSKQISSWNFSVADGCSESTNNVDSCDCNQGPRRVLLTRLTLTNDSILYNDVNFEFTFDTCGVKIIYPILTKGQIAGICIAGVCIICFIIFVILICYKCCGRTENTKYAPQTGNITCGFTDIQNSTVLWEQNEKGMREALIIHNDILRKLLETYRGYEVKTHGDSFYVAFADAVDALDWSIAVQHALLDAEWPSSLTQMWDCRTEWDLETKQKVWNGIRVRIGLHFGHADRIFDKTMHRPDYFGTTVNMASRIENSAYGGQVLISEEMFLELWKRLGVDMFKHVIFQDYNLQSYVEEIKTKILMETNDALSDVRSSMTLDLKSLPLSTNHTMDFRASISSLSSSMARKRHVSRPKYTCHDLGEFRLKGLQHMARLFEVKSDRTNKREFPAILRNLEKDPSVMSILSEGSSVETTHLRAHKFNNKVIPIVE
ncbi:hypothetical protein C9374_000905 [Naegleria lovaniensis]|uniref:Guanylate cyclase domain-containing protein n=1 Tax=Naegleria lovaniensis TaxID=51637 RepID=A0AA88GSG4_NAELO|nr:uncharacterized protein C9374_000905 [Naegleria lovaniensis]KAG2388055.1 hypothetical protein C9374_000905 [Naegleria lovaniensis]